MQPLDTYNQVSTVKKASPAVITILTKAEGTPSALGSGFNVDTLGVIVTNYHVVKGAREINVIFPDGNRFRVLSIIGLDRERDIAILKIAGFGLPVVPLGNSNDLQIGDQVTAIGSPQGFEGTPSTGIVSGRRQREGGMWLIQTTAPISPGSSGGPLFGVDGKVIGITTLTWAEKGTQNINFCIPINYARGLLASPESMPLSVLLDSTDSESITSIQPVVVRSDDRKEYDALISRIAANSIFILVSPSRLTQICTQHCDMNDLRRPRLSDLQDQRLDFLDRSLYGTQTTQNDARTRCLRLAKLSEGYYLQVDFVINKNNRMTLTLKLYDPKTLDMLYTGETTDASWRQNLSDKTAERLVKNGFRGFAVWAKQHMPQLLLTN